MNYRIIKKDTVFNSAPWAIVGIKEICLTSSTTEQYELFGAYYTKKEAQQDAREFGLKIVK